MPVTSLTLVFLGCSRYLAAGGTMKTIAESYRMAPCTMSGIVHEVCVAIFQRLAPLYLRSPTLDDWKASAEAFADQWQLPNCIGALDGKHVALEKPPGTGTLYHCYKGYSSVVLLAVADAHYRWVFVAFAMRFRPVHTTMLCQVITHHGLLLWIGNQQQSTGAPRQGKSGDWQWSRNGNGYKFPLKIVALAPA